MLTTNYVKTGNATENKYSRLQISIHWLAFLPVTVTYCATELRGFFLYSDRPLISTAHVSCGISIPVLMVVRLLLRLKCPAPPIIPKPKPMMMGLVHLGHLVIYPLFIALPVIGLVMIYNQSNPQFAFGLTMPYASEANPEQVDSLKSQCETLANLGYFVIGLHAAAVLVYRYPRKDNTLPRMIPHERP